MAVSGDSSITLGDISFSSSAVAGDVLDPYGYDTYGIGVYGGGDEIPESTPFTDYHTLDPYGYDVYGDGVYGGGSGQIPASVVYASATISLDGVTLDSTSISTISATASLTAGDAVISSSASLAIQASANLTLQDAVLSADGASTLSGSASIGLSDAVLSSAASTIPLSVGSADIQLSAATLTASISSDIGVDFAATFGSATTSGQVQTFISGGAGLSLDGATLSADGDVLTDAAVNAQLDDLQLSSDSSALAQADTSTTLDDLQVSGDAKTTVTADLAQSLDGVTLDSATALAGNADASNTLSDATLSSTVSIIAGPAGGEAYITTDDIQVSAGAVSQIGVAGALSLGDAQLNAFMSVLSAADVNSLLDDATINALSDVLLSADSSHNLDGVTVSSTGATYTGASLDALLVSVNVVSEAVSAITGQSITPLDDVSLNASTAVDVEALLNAALGGATVHAEVVRLLSQLEQIYLRANELWQLAGLDKNNPMTVTKTQRQTGNIDLQISGDGQSAVTVTRQHYSQTPPNLTDAELIADAHLKLTELHKFYGLDDSAPLQMTQTSRNAGDIETVISGDGENESTVTRQ